MGGRWQSGHGFRPRSSTRICNKRRVSQRSGMFLTRSPQRIKQPLCRRRITRRCFSPPVTAGPIKGLATAEADTPPVPPWVPARRRCRASGWRKLRGWTSNPLYRGCGYKIEQLQSADRSAGNRTCLIRGAPSSNPSRSCRNKACLESSGRMQEMRPRSRLQRPPQAPRTIPRSRPATAGQRISTTNEAGSAMIGPWPDYPSKTLMQGCASGVCSKSARRVWSSASSHMPRP